MGALLSFFTSSGSAPAWVTVFLDASVKGALLLLAAGCVGLLLRRASAAARHLVWFLALASLLVLPVLSLTLPAWRLPILPAARAAAPTVPVSLAEDTTSPVVAPSLGEMPVSQSPEEPAAGPESRQTSPVSSEVAAAPPPAPTVGTGGRMSAWHWLLVVWGTGASLVLAVLLGGTVSVLRIVRRAHPVEADSPWALLLGEFSRRLSVRRPVRLLISPRVTVPLACGLVRHVVLLPAESEEWPEERSRVVLLHELAHLRRKDCLTQALAQIACALYWFNPLAWLAVRSMRIERERACDDHVLNAGLEPSNYANHLLEIARSARASRRAALAAVAMARPGQLEGRLLAVLDPTRSRRPLTRFTVGVAAAAVACLLLPLAAVKLGAAAAEEPKTPSARAGVEDPMQGRGGLDAELERVEALHSSDGARIVGRVVDTEGQPVAGARASAWVGIQTPLRSAVMVSAETNEAGRFELHAPFPDVRYMVIVEKAGFRVTKRTGNVLAGDGRPVEAVLERVAGGVRTGVVMDGDSGAPVPGAEVSLLGQYGFRKDVRANASGQFEIQDIPDYIGQSVLLAQSQGRVSRIVWVRAHERDVELTLGAAASVPGIVKDLDSGEPVAGCRVTIGPTFASGFSLDAATADDGRFRFASVPPGEYQIVVSSDRYVEPPTRGDFLEPFRFPLRAGQESSPLHMGVQRMAMVAGRVVGPDGQPVAGAVVGTAATWVSYQEPQWSVARTDGEGRFSVRSGRLRRKEEVVACSSRWGLGRAVVEVPGAGESLPDVVIQLAGAVRVRGLVRDSDGAPLKGIFVGGDIGMGGADISDDQGRFNLGWVPSRLPPGAGNSLTFLSPHPDRGSIGTRRVDGTRRPAKEPAPGARFFHHKLLPLEAKPGEEADLDVTLGRAELINFTGTVFDARGRPVPQAVVVLFAGKSTMGEFLRLLRPALPNDLDLAMEHRAAPLCLTLTDEAGRWSLWGVRETAEDLTVEFHSSADPSVYTVGAEGPGGTALVEDLVLAEGEKSKAVDVRLGGGP